MGDLAGMELVPEQPSWQQLSGRAGGSTISLTARNCHEENFRKMTKTVLNFNLEEMLHSL